MKSLLAENVFTVTGLLTVWMLNRLINSKPPDRDRLLVLLQTLADHPAATELAKYKATKFVEFHFQRVRGR